MTHNELLTIFEKEYHQYLLDTFTAEYKTLGKGFYTKCYYCGAILRRLIISRGSPCCYECRAKHKRELAYTHKMGKKEVSHKLQRKYLGAKSP